MAKQIKTDTWVRLVGTLIPAHWRNRSARIVRPTDLPGHWIIVVSDGRRTDTFEVAEENVRVLD